MLPQPLLQVPVASQGERGMLGIAVAKHKNGPTYVFLYFTESGGRKTGDDSTARYHNGGKIVIGPDKNVYVGIGDVNEHNYINGTTQAENAREAPPPDGRGGILRITQNGEALHGIIGKKVPLNLYYAYGIRNTFGMDFDPKTRNIWDTENGPFYGDEVNLVKPGFNSGWRKVQGIWEPISNYPFPGSVQLQPNNNLVDFGGKGKYRAPEFMLYMPDAGPTGFRFLHSDKLGKQYKDDMFIGDFHHGNLYDFHLSKDSF